MREGDLVHKRRMWLEIERPYRWNSFKKYSSPEGQCSSIGWVSSRAPQGCRFILGRGINPQWGRQLINVSLSPILSLSKNQFKKKKKKGNIPYHSRFPSSCCPQLSKPGFFKNCDKQGHHAGRSQAHTSHTPPICPSHPLSPRWHYLCCTALSLKGPTIWWGCNQGNSTELTESRGRHRELGV